MMNKRDILRAKKAIEKVSKNLDTEHEYLQRGKSRQEYRPNEKTEAVPSTPNKQIIHHVIEHHRGFSRPQTCLLMTLTGVLSVICICAALLSLPLIFGPDPLFQPTPVGINVSTTPPNQQVAILRLSNQTANNLSIVDVRISPYTGQGFIKPGPGNWWLVEISFRNNGNRPVTVLGYNIVIKDKQGREYWYDQGLSVFGTNQDFIAQINPGVTVTTPAVFNLPQVLDGATIIYDGAVVPIMPENITR